MHTSGLWEMKTEVCTLLSAKRVDLVKVNTYLYHIYRRCDVALRYIEISILRYIEII